MAALKNKLLYAAASFSAGMGTLALPGTCQGASCQSCFGCVGVGAGILLVVLCHKLKDLSQGTKDGG